MGQEPGGYPVVSIIAFNHARLVIPGAIGPEVEHWIGVEKEGDISDWPLLPFLALTDGAHSYSEDFSYFTLKHTKGPNAPTTLFGISCTRQLDSRELIERPPDVTRSTVQKAVVVIADSPTVFFGHLKQQLSAVTQAWFAQRNFEDLDIIRRFQESLKASAKISQGNDNERDHYVGLSLREFIFEFKHQALVLFKCMLLQPKMLFFGTRGDRLCMTQFSLVSLIPGLLRCLQDSSDPELDSYESTLVKPTSVRTSDRKSLLTFMGLPLQIFGKGSLFGPYTPLQQLDVLSDAGTKSYIVGSTNSLLLQQRDRYSDILINMDDMTVNITSTSLRTALSLSAADRRWIDSLVLSVTDSWDEADPSRPKTLGFVGSEDYIRLQFEEYVLSMVSAVKYHLFMLKHAGSDQNVFLPDIEGDPSADFNPDFVDYWKKTDNFRIFQKFTEPEIFDLVPPKHVMAGGLTVEDVQRRIAQQVHEFGLDEKVSAGKEAVAKAVANGRNNLSLAFTNISKNVEQYREHRRLQSQASQASQNATPTENSVPEKSSAPSTGPTSPVDAPSSKASAYFSSWAYWAGDKRKKAFAEPTSPPAEPAAEKPSARSSLFSRWSRGSVDIARKVDDAPPRDSTETTRETVFEGTEAAQDRLEDKPLPEMRKSLPPPPTPPKDNVPEPSELESTTELPIAEDAPIREPPPLPAREPSPSPVREPSASPAREPSPPPAREPPSPLALPHESQPMSQIPEPPVEKDEPQSVMLDGLTKPDDATAETALTEAASSPEPETLAPQLPEPEITSESLRTELEVENTPTVDSIVKRLSLKLDEDTKPLNQPAKQETPIERVPQSPPTSPPVRDSLLARTSPVSPRKPETQVERVAPQTPVSLAKRDSVRSIPPQSPASPAKRDSLLGRASPASPSKRDSVLGRTTPVSPRKQETPVGRPQSPPTSSAARDSPLGRTSPASPRKQESPVRSIPPQSPPSLVKRDSLLGRATLASPTKQETPVGRIAPQTPASPAKRDTVLERASPALSKKEEPAGATSPLSPTSPTKGEARPPVRTSVQSSIAARRAMFEKQ